MWTYGHGAEGQPGRAVEELPDALHLVVELAALRGTEGSEQLHGDLDRAAGAALVPDPGDHPAHEQHRHVTCLTAGKRALGGHTGEDQLARIR